MWDVLRRGKYQRFSIAFLFGIFFFLSGSFLREGPITPVARAMVTYQNQRAVSPTCPGPKEPTNQSMLIVVLDRSGSLIGSDPNEYSTSVAKILADLWPGSMAVILMSGVGDALQYLGPETLSSNNARQHLKDEIEQQRNQLGAFTPLEASLDKAFGLLSRNNFPAGSRVILITDGEPSIPGDLQGTQQKQDIENRIIPQFCSQGIPINAFGLSINNASDPIANALLKEVTDNTGGATFEEYHNVTNPASLGEAVITLYAKWRGLTLVPVNPQSGIFPVNIDTYARQAYVVTFHSSSKVLPLLGADHQEVPEAAFQQHSIDTHYDFYNLSRNNFSTSGQYSVDASTDSEASVYKLEDSRLRVTIISPTSQTIAYEGQPFTVTAAFYDANINNHVHLNLYQGSMVVTCALLANGKSTSCGEGPLNQQPKPNDDLFSNQLTPSQVGMLTIKVTGIIQDVPIEEAPSVTLHVQIAPCSFGNVGCYWDRYHTQILIAGPSILLLLLLLLWLFIRFSRPKPFGWVANDRSSIELARFHKPIISSRELQSRGTFRFDNGTRFELVFKKDGRAYIRSAKGNGSQITVNTAGTSRAVTGQGVELKIGSTFTDRRDVASFINTPKKRQF